jgi:hypothetical protein
MVSVSHDFAPVIGKHASETSSPRLLYSVAVILTVIAFGARTRRCRSLREDFSFANQHSDDAGNFLLQGSWPNDLRHHR